MKYLLLVTIIVVLLFAVVISSIRIVRKHEPYSTLIVLSQKDSGRNQLHTYSAEKNKDPERFYIYGRTTYFIVAQKGILIFSEVRLYFYSSLFKTVNSYPLALSLDEFTGVNCRGAYKSNRLIQSYVRMRSNDINAEISCFYIY